MAARVRKPEGEHEACLRLIDFQQKYLLPAARRYHGMRHGGDFDLLDAYTLNSLLASFIEYAAYIQNIRCEGRMNKSKWMDIFDDYYDLGTCEQAPKKYKLVCAVNNAIKHVRLDRRWEKLEEVYGTIDHDVLSMQDGDVVFESKKYRFDYAKIILRPVEAVFASCELSSVDDVCMLLDGEMFGVADDGLCMDDYEGDPDPIEQMIDYCNPQCLNCGMGEMECRCSNYSYNGISGEFDPARDPIFDFDQVMSRISGTY